MNNTQIIYYGKKAYNPTYVKTQIFCKKMN